MAETRGRDFIGRSVRRRDGVDKVSGRAGYPQDLPLPEGCLHAATVRAPVACAGLDGVQTQHALKVDGVVRILTAADVRGTNRVGLAEPDQPVLVERDIIGPSDVVAVVVARTERAAREGARRVTLILTEREGCHDPELALRADAHIVQPGRESSGGHPNLLAERVVRAGDADAALGSAPVIIDATYHTGPVEHAFLAPEAGLAWPEADGSLTLQVATQWPQADLEQVATALAEPRDRLQIIQASIGGAFGGREDLSIQALLFLAARAVNAPVRMSWNRRESIRGHGKRHPFRIHFRLAADHDGTILGAVVDLLMDAGCYASTSGPMLDNAIAHMMGAYRVPHLRVSGRAVFTNNPFSCAFRGFGGNEVAFAIEQQLNKLAERVGIDPVVIRMRNVVRSGSQLAPGSRIGAVAGFKRTLSRTASAARVAPLPAPDGSLVYGRGIASGIKNHGYGFGARDRATAEVSLSAGRAIVRIGAAEVGQGVENVVLQIAATELSLPVDAINVEWRDTRTAPDAGSSSASRQTVASGNAVRVACAAARRALERKGGWRRIASGSLTVRRTWSFPGTLSFDQRPGRHLAGFSFGACVADVAVDTGTGQVTVRRVVSASDAGRVINPRLYAGQVEGGVVMGQGYALQERVELEKGMPVSAGFESCGVPTSVDATPEIEVIAVEVHDPIGPYGARGVGEITMIPVVPAIIAAIHDACGVWIDTLPASPERVLAALATKAVTPSKGRRPG